MLKKSTAAFSLRSEVQRTEAYASPLRSLRPCWTAFLSILRNSGISTICEIHGVWCINRVFPQPTRELVCSAPPESRNSMRIVVSGGRGSSGRPYVASLCQEGYRITLLTRRKQEGNGRLAQTVTDVEWNGKRRGSGALSRRCRCCHQSRWCRRLPMDAGPCPQATPQRSRVHSTRLL